MQQIGNRSHLINMSSLLFEDLRGLLDFTLVKKRHHEDQRTQQKAQSIDRKAITYALTHLAFMKE